MGCWRIIAATGLALANVLAFAQTPVPRRISDLDEAGSAQKAPTAPTCNTPSDEIVYLESVRLVGLSKLAVAAESAIEASLTRRYYDSCVLESEVVEQVRDGVQQHGYFLAEVSEPQVTDLENGDGPRKVALVVRVDEGELYRLGSVSFSGYTAAEIEQVRATFPMSPGEVFDTAKVRMGLESLRRLYGRLGYLDAAPMPKTEVDRVRRQVALRIAIDEGRQYRLRTVTVLGVDETTKQSLLADWTIPAGKPFNSRLLENFFLEHRYALPPGASAEKNADVQMDARSYSVDVTLDFRAEQ